MVSKRLLACYAFVDAWLLAAGVLSIAMSIVWKAPNLMLNLTLSSSDLLGEFLLSPYPHRIPWTSSPPLFCIAGMILGIILLATFLVSIVAIVQPNHITIGLVILNWTLVVDGLAILVVGTYLWYFTLGIRTYYFHVYNAASADIRVQIQNEVCDL